jgi:hypothetical protein
MPKLPKFENRGVREAKRKLYLQHRSQARMDELDELECDVDYLMAEIRRLERRTGVPGLIPPRLIFMAVQIEYILHRKDYPSDYAIVKKMADEFCRSTDNIGAILFGEFLCDTGSYFVKETEGGNEADYFLPDDARADLPDFPEIKGKRYSKCSRYELITVIKYLTKRLLRAEQIVHGTVAKSHVYQYLQEAIKHPIENEDGL